MSKPPIFIGSLFLKVLAWVEIIAVAMLVAVIMIFGRITTLDMFGTLISAAIIAYIAHLWIYYGRNSQSGD